MCESCERAAIPEGRTCAHCDDAVLPHDQGLLLPYYGRPGDPSELAYHRVCFMSLVLPIEVHMLRHGFAVCGFSRDIPAHWPKTHYWTDRERQVTCRGCKTAPA